MSPDKILDYDHLLEKLDVIDADHKLSNLCDGTSELRFDLTGFRNPVRNASLEWLGIEKNKFEKTESIRLTIEDMLPDQFTERVINETTTFVEHKCIYIENPFWLINWNRYKNNVTTEYSFQFQRGQTIIK